MSSDSSIGNLLFVVLIVFVTMKLFGVMPIAAWSWWMVFSPMWIGIGVFLTVITLISVVLFLIALFSKK